MVNKPHIFQKFIRAHGKTIPLAAPLMKSGGADMEGAGFRAVKGVKKGSNH